MEKFNIKFGIKYGAFLFLNKQKEFNHFNTFETILFDSREEAEMCLDNLNLEELATLSITIEKIYLKK